MTPKPQVECALAAAFLQSGRVASNAANISALIGAAGALVSHVPAARWLFAASLVAWAAGCYFGLRVAADAALFRALGPEPGERADILDEALRAWGLGNGKPGRTIAERSRGAIRLWRSLIAAVALQLAALSAGIIIQTWFV